MVDGALQDVGSSASIIQSIGGNIDIVFNAGSSKAEENWYYKELFASGSTDHQGVSRGPVVSCPDLGTLTQSGSTFGSLAPPPDNPVARVNQTYIASDGHIKEQLWSWSPFYWSLLKNLKTTPYDPLPGQTQMLNNPLNLTGYEVLGSFLTSFSFRFGDRLPKVASCDIYWDFTYTSREGMRSCTLSQHFNRCSNMTLALPRPEDCNSI